MTDSVRNEFYRDFKRALKITVKITVVFIAISLVIGSAYWGYSEFQQASKEKEILSRALPFTKVHKPWIFTRTDFGNETKLELWFLGDTDKHAIIKVNNEYSIYSTESRYNFIYFDRDAGSACNYATANYDDKRILSVTCSGIKYNAGPLNEVN